MRWTGVAVAFLFLLAGSQRLRAQDLEPRAYSASPVVTDFVLLGVGSSRGAVLFDASVPIADVSADIAQTVVGYGRTFALGSRQGLVGLAIPYAWGHVEGEVQEQARRVRRSGLADARVKASVNLLGPKAMSPEEFRNTPRTTILGVSLTVQIPIGEYDPTKLINLGTGRWALKPEVGLSVPVGRWFLDAYAGVWFFETNDDFYPGDSTRRQDPLTAVQGHASYTFQNRAWFAIDATWFGGGSSTIDSGPPSTRQSSTRLGGTFSVPITPRQSVKFAASFGTTARTGTDFDTYVAAWQFTWFGRPHEARP